VNTPVKDYICVDLETTGLNPKMDRIIEIGAVRVQNGVITDTFSEFVYPGRKLEEKITELTGIRDCDLEGKPMIEEVLPRFLAFAEELPLLGHSVLFDYSFLKRAAVNQRLTFERKGIDTLKIARKYLQELPSRNLGALCAYYQIPHHAHRALEDAKATHLLYGELCRQFCPQFCLQNSPADNAAILDFVPQILSYQVKREGPATPAQKERLKKMLKQYNITPDYEVDWLTKNEASRKIDKLMAEYKICSGNGR